MSHPAKRHNLSLLNEIFWLVNNLNNPGQMLKRLKFSGRKHIFAPPGKKSQINK